MSKLLLQNKTHHTLHTNITRNYYTSTVDVCGKNIVLTYSCEPRPELPHILHSQFFWQIAPLESCSWGKVDGRSSERSLVFCLVVEIYTGSIGSALYTTSNPLSLNNNNNKYDKTVLLILTTCPSLKKTQYSSQYTVNRTTSNSTYFLLSSYNAQL